MDIFESLENLNVSEECFDEIMGLVEELLSEEDVYEPAAYAKDGYNFMATGSNKLNGKLYKVHTKHDKGVTKTKLYAKDGDSARKLVQKAYGGPDSAHTLANESLYNEIADLVEELISELHAPTSDSATAVFDRKAARLQANTTKNEILGDHIAQANKGDFHNRYPNSDTQHRYNYEGELRKEQGKIAKESDKLQSSGQRIFNWARRKKAQGQLTQDMKDSANRMRHAGIENQNSRAEYAN